MTNLISDSHSDISLTDISSNQCGTEIMPYLYHEDNTHTQRFFVESQDSDQAKASLEVHQYAGQDNASSGFDKKANNTEEKVGYIEATYSFIRDKITNSRIVRGACLVYLFFRCINVIGRFL